ncbi:MAG: hypothetical protein EOO65_01040 [Methanosarcinales archaeon]|nr:MAG: hypothetical protein EOO65_01040 [Methanosarcinales archaeon]
MTDETDETEDDEDRKGDGKWDTYESDDDEKGDKKTEGEDDETTGEKEADEIAKTVESADGEDKKQRM